jgi:hypothetical protein
MRNTSAILKPKYIPSSLGLFRGALVDQWPPQASKGTKDTHIISFEAQSAEGE